MGDLSNQFLNAMNILVEKGMSELKFDRTVEAIISGIKDESVGEYWAKYNGNIILVYARDPKEKYKINDKVFIKIPENDLSNKKFIENKGRTFSGENDDLSNNEIADLEHTFLPVDPSIFNMYNLTLQDEYSLIAADTGKKEIEICSCQPPVDILYKEIKLNEKNYAPNKYYLKDSNGKYFLDPSSNFDNNKNYFVKDFSSGKFQKYLKKYKYILLSGNFRSLLFYPFTSGNYGLKVSFYNAQDINKDIIYELDINSFNGNPYKFINNTYQQSILALESEKILGLKSVTFFQKDFPHYDYRLDGTNTKIENSTQPNLFVSNISLQFVEEVDLSKNLYYLQIQTPQGIIFEDNSISLDLIGRLISGKQSIMTEENTICKWYKRDSSISTGDKFYDKSIGPGWRKIIYDEEAKSLTDYYKAKKEYEKLLIDKGSSELLEYQLNKINILIQEIKNEYQDIYDLLIKTNHTLSKNELNNLINFVNSNTITQESYEIKTQEFENKCLECTKVLRDPEIIKFNKLTVPKKIVNNKNDYQLGIVYNNKIQLFQMASVYKYEEGYNVKIEKKVDKDNNEYLELISEDSNIFVGDWYFSLSNGNGYQPISKATNVSKILINDYLAYYNPIFICDIKIKTGTENNPIYTYIETKEFYYNNYIPDENNSSSISVTFVGESVYNYDANGDITLKDASISRQLSCVLNRRDLTIDKIEWFIINEPGGKEIFIPPAEKKPSQSGFINFSSKSMLKDLWVDTNGNLQYNIKQKYQLNGNNTVHVKITVEQQEYYFQKELIFLKDGDQGTNGTTCSLIVNIEDNDTSKSRYLHYNNKWENIIPLKLKAYLYENGIDRSNEVKSFEWSCGDSIRFCSQAGTEDSKKALGAIAYIKGYSTIEDNFPSFLNKNNTQFYVKVKATYKGTSIYNIFPIKVIVGKLTEENADKIILPQTIKYNSAGENPQFIRDFTYGSPFTNYSAIPIGTENKIEVKYENSILTLRPNRKFLCNNKNDVVNSIKCFTDVTSDYLIYPIVMFLNRYGNEAINDWDGTQIDIGVNREYIFAPQIGAGEKHNDNTFSGVIMGRNSLDNQNGLYGFNHGEATFGFKENGQAFIGRPEKGQIIFDTERDTAVIQSSNYKENKVGMKLDLTNGIIDIKGSKVLENQETGFITINADTESIRNKKPLEIGIGNKPNFSVDWNGSLYANAGTIGGWMITPNGLTNSGNKSGFNSNAQDTDLILWAGNTSKDKANFKVAADGTVTISNAILKGNITWDTTSSPVQVQYTTDPKDPNKIINEWNNEWTNANTKVWARYSYDGGKNYGVWVVIQGTDGSDGEPGAPGSSGMDKAAINKYLRETYGISDSETSTFGKCYIYSPNIVSKKFEIIAPEISDGGGLLLKGNYLGTFYDMFAIEYHGDTLPPSVQIYSPASANIIFGNSLKSDNNFIFYGNVDFSFATSVNGVHAQFL